jgi:hypothetical protein
MTYIPDPKNKFCLRCEAFLRNGRFDYCDICVTAIERAKQKVKLISDLVKF